MSPPTPPPPRLITFRHLVKVHHGRAYFLGGSWVAMAVATGISAAALINPRSPIPGVDQALGSLPSQTAALALREVEELAPEPAPAIAQASGESASPPIDPEPEAAQPPAETPAPLMVPVWVYGMIFASCLLGSSLLTYALYLLYQSPHRGAKLLKKTKKTKTPIRRSPQVPISRPQDS
jgi:hypothetical protein